MWSLGAMVSALSVFCCRTLRGYVMLFLTMNRGAIVMTLVSLYCSVSLENLNHHVDSPSQDLQRMTSRRRCRCRLSRAACRLACLPQRYRTKEAFNQRKQIACKSAYPGPLAIVHAQEQSVAPVVIREGKHWAMSADTKATGLTY